MTTQSPPDRASRNEQLTASDWTAARGARWRAQCAGMEATLAPVDAPLLRALRLDAPLSIADLGCGGGGTTLELLRRAPAGSVVRGFDIAPVLVDLAQSRVAPDDDRIAFAVADVATATPDRPYDRLVSRFGVMFFDEPRGAFENLHRWLAPGGRFAFAVWGRPSDNPWMSVTREVVSRVVEIPPATPNAPGPFRYADPAPLLALLDHAGFTELDATAWRGELPLGGGLPPEAAARFALASFASFAELLAEAGADARDEALRALTARFNDYPRNGAVHMGASVSIVTGARR